MPTTTLTRNYKRAPGKGSTERIKRKLDMRWNNLVSCGEGAPRFFSPRECARLQGFPDSFQLLFPGSSDTPMPALFGNAVAPPVAAAAAGALLAAWKPTAFAADCGVHVALQLVCEAVAPAHKQKLQETALQTA
mmetsp:Transcript_42706/g.96221  ORF Transcript_42706/g.96221 Transcript_42706/m.96221 type:complete len:134 (+) Transcript_42706:743-1144(+)